MRRLSPPQPALPEAWAQVLDDVEATLRSAEAAAAERGEAIRHFDPASTAPEARAAQWQQALARLQERMEGWQTILQQAEKEAAEADEELKAGEDILRRWLSQAEMLGQSLAKWVPPGV